MTSTAVKHILSTYRGVPTINGNTPGCGIAALDFLLVTGGGATVALAVTVSDGVATATLNAGSSFAEDAVVLVSGATPAQLNGEARVITSSNTQITWSTTAPDGLATGSITIKYAPAGWEKVYSGTNKAVYRSQDVEGARHYLRVDDTHNLYMRVIGYEAMSDLDTGIGPFPTNDQITGGGYLHKSTGANATAVPYAIAADSRSMLSAILAGVGANANNVGSVVRGFGCCDALNPAGDVWSTYLSCDGSNSGIVSGGLSGSVQDSSGNGLTVSPRGWQGLGGAVLQRPMPVSGDTSLSGVCALMGAAPSVIDGQIKTSRVFLRDQVTGAAPRSIVPSVRYIPQTGVLTLLPTALKKLDIEDGRKAVVVPVSSGYGTPATGVALIDIAGPWRE